MFRYHDACQRRFRRCQGNTQGGQESTAHIPYSQELGGRQAQRLRNWCRRLYHQTFQHGGASGPPQRHHAPLVQ